jgi:hypothetical protein
MVILLICLILSLVQIASGWHPQQVISNIRRKEMRGPIFSRTAYFTAAALFAFAARSHAAVVTVSSATMTDAYMSWTPLPGGGGGASASPWSVSALDASFNGAGNQATVSPNTNIADSDPGDPYWFIGGNTNDPGQLMDASLYAEVDNISDLNWTFNYNVISNTFNFSGPPSGMTSSNAFIKAFAPGYAYIGEVTAPLTVGMGSLNLNPSTAGFSSLAAGDIIQYGFETVGPDMTDSAAAAAGNAVIGAVVPEPTTCTILLGLAGSYLLRRKRIA